MNNTQMILKNLDEIQKEVILALADLKDIIDKKDANRLIEYLRKPVPEKEKEKIKLKRSPRLRRGLLDFAQKASIIKR